MKKKTINREKNLDFSLLKEDNILQAGSKPDLKKL